MISGAPSLGAGWFPTVDLILPKYYHHLVAAHESALGKFAMFATDCKGRQPGVGLVAALLPSIECRAIDSVTQARVKSVADYVTSI